MPDWADSLNDVLFKFVTRGAPRDHLIAFAPLGFIVGILLAHWSAKLIARESHGARRLTLPGRFSIIAATTILYPALVYAVIHLRCQWLTEGGSIDWAQWRMPYYFVLLGLLIVATAVDLDQYLIPDDITITGTLIGVVWATVFGHMHLIPLWIDWNNVHFIEGPYIPEWIKHHPHGHGLLWSLAGIAAGAGITWLARFVSHTVLGVEALGFGDVTLMGMIGSFLGWQPVLLVFLIAPIFGVAVSVTLKMAHSRRAVPYGPYLSVAAIFVLFNWTRLWIPTRELFGHGPTLLGLGGLAIVTLVLLLGMIRLYRSIPVTRRAERPAEIDAPVIATDSTANSPAAEGVETESPSIENSPESSAGEDALPGNDQPERAPDTNAGDSARATD